MTQSQKNLGFIIPCTFPKSPQKTLRIIGAEVESGPWHFVWVTQLSSASGIWYFLQCLHPNMISDYQEQHYQTLVYATSCSLLQIQQEHPRGPPRGSIVEPQGLRQDSLNSQPYNGLKTPISIEHEIYRFYKRINHAVVWVLPPGDCPNLHLPPIHMKSWPKLKLGQVGVGSNIAQNHSSIPGKSYLVIICPNSKVDQKWI